MIRIEVLMTTILKIIYWAGLIGQIIIRAPHEKVRKGTERKKQQVTTSEKAILSLLLIGGFVFPLVYSLTDWLAFADYSLPAWAGWLGVVLLAVALVIFYRGHADLKANWSPSLEIFKGHKLVKNGIYGVIRHPMYASQWVFATAQALLLQNWIAGLAGLAVFVPFYWLRVSAEEKMMVETFGDEYRQYMKKTGRVLPKLN